MTITSYDYTDERREAREARADYHLRNIVMDEDLVRRCHEWHGGQYTMMYSLASTGQSDFVSQSMLDAAADELGRPGKFPVDDPGWHAEQHDLWCELSDLAHDPDESTAEACGCSTSDSGQATWLMTD